MVSSSGVDGMSSSIAIFPDLWLYRWFYLQCQVSLNMMRKRGIGNGPMDDHLTELTEVNIKTCVYLPGESLYQSGIFFCILPLFYWPGFVHNVHLVVLLGK